jgi:hypothetical protein
MQWYEKLDSNTTLDDIAIGEAYLHFLHGAGDWGDFWWYLWEHYKLSRDYLSSMKCGWSTAGITGPAAHLPWLIPDVKHLLFVLKVIHSGTSLQTCKAKGNMPNSKVAGTTSNQNHSNGTTAPSHTSFLAWYPISFVSSSQHRTTYKLVSSRSVSEHWQ